MKQILILLIPIIVFACGEPEPRRPVKVRTGSFIRQSAERNKELLVEEEAKILDIIAKDSLNTYITSASGFWYFYQRKNENATNTPESGDLITFQHNILSLENDTIYSTEELGIRQYLVDKEDQEMIFPGLRNSVKLMKEQETATFIYPSSLAFGYPGDKARIGPNVTIKSTLTLLQIIKQQDSTKN